MENVIEKILLSPKNIEEKKNYLSLFLSKSNDQIKFILIIIEKLLQENNVFIF